MRAPIVALGGGRQLTIDADTIGEFVPGVQRLGLQPIEAWATIYGEYPQIQVGLLADDATRANSVLDSPEWTDLQEQLFGYVNNFSYKVIPARGGFQF